MRVFLAAAADEQVKAAAERVVARLRRAGADYRWVDPRDMHVTFRYFGATEPSRLPEIKTLMASAAAKAAPFEIVYGGVGAFDSLGDPRVLWVGLEEGEPAMKKIAELLGDDEPWPYSAHLTLGRRRRPVSPELFAALKAEPVWSLRRPVTRISLYASRPASFGHAYEILAEAELGG